MSFLWPFCQLVFLEILSVAPWKILGPSGSYVEKYQLRISLVSIENLRIPKLTADSFQPLTILPVSQGFGPKALLWLFSFLVFFSFSFSLH